MALVAICYLALASATRGPRRRALLVAFALADVASFALEPVRSNASFGQINVFLMLLVVADATRSPSRTRGVLIDIAAAIKLTPLLYLGYLLVARDRRAAIRGAATFAGITAISWIADPSDSARFLLHDAFDAHRVGTIGYVSNQSWYGLVHRAPFRGDEFGIALWCVAELVTLVVGLLTARRLVLGGHGLEALFAVALLELLVSPISWTHHWSWLVLAPIVLIARFAEHRRGGFALELLLAIAVLHPYWWRLSGPTVVAVVASDALALAGAGMLVALALSTRLAEAPVAALPVLVDA